jgi:hypothetical protein
MFQKAPFRVRALQTPAATKGVAPAPAEPAQGDPYLTRLVKLIPSEVITLYLAFKTTAAGTVLEVSGWAAICLGLVILARAVGTYEKGKGIQIMAVIVSTVSFILWIYATNGYFPILGQIAQNNMGLISIGIGVWTFLVPYLYKGA